MATSLPLITVAGSPFDRGLSHGTQGKDLVQRAVWLWRERAARLYGVHADAFIRRFLAETDYVSAIREFTPGLMEEVEGMAEGADVDFDTMFAFQLMDEVWRNGARTMDKCTAMGVGRSGGRPTLLAQNMDIEGFRNGYQVVVRHRLDNGGPDVMVLTCAGLIATTGLNRAGVGVCVNALGQLRYEMEGLPVAFVVRGALDCSGLDDACAFVTEVNHTTGQNYMVGGPERVRSYECSAGGAAPYVGDSSGTIVHTNHPFASTDFTPQHRTYRDEHPDAPPGGASSRTRFETATKMLAARDGDVDVKAMQAILSSGHTEYPVCVPYVDVSSGHTFGSVVMELGGEPVLHASAGPPDTGGYHRFGWR